MLFKKIILTISILFLPIAVLASEGVTYDIPFLSDKLENIFEIVNLLLAILAASYAIKLAALTQGGQMEKTWNMLALAGAFFALVEILGALKGFGIMNVHGAAEIFELLLALTLLKTFMITRKMLLKQIMDK